MSLPRTYPIGTPGTKWGETEKAQWLAAQTIKRLYADEVLPKIEALKASFAVEQYGALSLDPTRYPLFVVKTQDWNPARPAVLVTGGVHGYETSGVQGALRFLDTDAKALSSAFNFVVFPCLSPWGYETINRWNPLAIDPNRSFGGAGACEEAAAVIKHLNSLAIDFVAHFDLHETTDTDNSEFGPARAARDGIANDEWAIPDGFYGVGDLQRPAPDFQKAIITEVAKVTHIAEDSDGKIIGEPLEQWGVINYDAGPLGLCMGLTGAEFVTTTEVYPDSPRATDQICIEAQVAAIRGGLSHIRHHAR